MALCACSFTGHRQIKKEHISEISGLIDKGIEYAYSNGCRTFYSGGAIGFDTLAARAVIRFRITHPDVRLVLCLPCINQDEMWSESQRDDYGYLIRSADEVIYVSDGYTPNCMRERNEMLAERADFVISYVGRARSGSAQTAKMAQRLGKTVYNLYPTLDAKTNKNKGRTYK